MAWQIQSGLQLYSQLANKTGIPQHHHDHYKDKYSKRQIKSQVFVMISMSVVAYEMELSNKVARQRFFLLQLKFIIVNKEMCAKDIGSYQGPKAPLQETDSS
jgi:hypothetical protein